MNTDVVKGWSCETPSNAKSIKYAPSFQAVPSSSELLRWWRDKDPSTQTTWESKHVTMLANQTHRHLIFAFNVFIVRSKWPCTFKRELTRSPLENYWIRFEISSQGSLWWIWRCTTNSRDPRTELIYQKITELRHQLSKLQN